MGHRGVILKAAAILLGIWAVVWAVRAYAGSQKITAQRVSQKVNAANFADWSEGGNSPDSAEGKLREEKLREIAQMVNRLDFQEREKNRADRTGETFFRKLSPQEKSKFIDLTVMESMSQFMKSIDMMPPDQRRGFVERGLREIKEGRTGAEMVRADELDPKLLDRITKEGMRAYFEDSSAETKLDLAPLMEAMNETMQGLRGNEFGQRP